MICFSVLDKDCRYIYLSNTAVGSGLTPDQFPGTYPWDWVSPEQREEHEMFYRRVFAEKRNASIGILWGNGEGFEKFYWTKVSWVGKDCIGAVSHTWEFPAELDELTVREHTILAEIGRGDGVADVARCLELSQSTVHSHLVNIRAKLELHSVDAVTAFAAQYRSVIASQNEDAP